jgi:hypothetical protein
MRGISGVSAAAPLHNLPDLRFETLQAAAHLSQHCSSGSAFESPYRTSLMRISSTTSLLASCAAALAALAAVAGLPIAPPPPAYQPHALLLHHLSTSLMRSSSRSSVLAACAPPLADLY